VEQSPDAGTADIRRGVDSVTEAEAGRAALESERLSLRRLGRRDLRWILEEKAIGRVVGDELRFAILRSEGKGAEPT
jgi:hypothetical protein